MDKSLGQKLVGVNFNPSSLSTVDEIKQTLAEIIDLVHDSIENVASEEALMIHNEAMRRIIDAQMWAVKAITYKD